MPSVTLIAVLGVVVVAVQLPIALVVVVAVVAAGFVVAIQLPIVLVVVAVAVDVLGVVVVMFVLFAFVLVAFVVIALAGVALYRLSFWGSGSCVINARHARSASLVLSPPLPPSFKVDAWGSYPACEINARFRSRASDPDSSALFQS